MGARTSDAAARRGCRARTDAVSTTRGTAGAVPARPAARLMPTGPNSTNGSSCHPVGRRVPRFVARRACGQRWHMREACSCEKRDVQSTCLKVTNISDPAPTDYNIDLVNHGTCQILQSHLEHDGVSAASFFQAFHLNRFACLPLHNLSKLQTTNKRKFFITLPMKLFKGNCST